MPHGITATLDMYLPYFLAATISKTGESFFWGFFRTNFGNLIFLKTKKILQDIVGRDLTVVLAYNKRTTVSCPAIFICFNFNTFKGKYTYHRLGTWGKPLVAFSISNLPHPRNQAMHSYLPHLDHPTTGLVHIQIQTTLLSFV